ncbi:MAG TPA: Hsp20/alpha crystallin family protein [Sulfurovum sp.]|uniref:Hsp20/alpha crystallin family protein n=1 Tax=Sulfurovum sp. TaxID=1969726 RepID=UPI002F94F856
MFSKKISFLILPLLAVSALQAEDPFSADPFGDEIFKEMYQMQKEMDKIFERMHQRMEERTKQWNYPPGTRLIPDDRGLNRSTLVDKGTYYEYNTQIPEGKNNQIDISIEEGILHFKAKVDRVNQTEQADRKTQQRFVSMVQRSETLPEDADPSSLKSEYQNGVLVLTLQKKKHLKYPALKEEKQEVSPPVQKVPEKEETKETNGKKENNRTKVVVPHTSSHV